jgi:hypothetical protein
VASAFRSSIAVLARSLSTVIYVVVFLLPWAVLVTIVWMVAAWVRMRIERTRVSAD